MLEGLRAARADLKRRANTQLNLGNQELLDDLFDRAQVILVEMYKAKKHAADEAAKPFVEQLDEIDNELAVFLQLIG